MPSGRLFIPRVYAYGVFSMMVWVTVFWLVMRLTAPNTFVWLVTCCAHVHVLRKGGFGNACLTLDGLAEGLAKQLCMLQNMIDMFAELVLLHRKH